MAGFCSKKLIHLKGFAGRYERFRVNPKRFGINPNCFGVNPNRFGVSPNHFGVHRETLVGSSGVADKRPGQNVELRFLVDMFRIENDRYHPIAQHHRIVGAHSANLCIGSGYCAYGILFAQAFGQGCHSKQIVFA